MPWQQLGGANAGLPANAIDATIHWLGTRDNDPLIIRTENGPLGPSNAPNPAAEVMRITPADPAVLGGALPRSVGIGTQTPRRKLHVEPSEIHTGGSGAGFFLRQPSGPIHWPTLAVYGESTQRPALGVVCHRRDGASLVGHGQDCSKHRWQPIRSRHLKLPKRRNRLGRCNRRRSHSRR
jgi:hypothetical protein